MPYNVTKEGFGVEDLDPTGANFLPELSDDIQRTLARLLGFHETSAKFKLLLCDTDGRLLVSSSATQASTATNSVQTVDATGETLLNDNTSRKQYIIQNLGTADIYITFGDTPATATGFKLVPDAVFADDVYTGKVTAITVSGSADVRIVEM